MFQSDDFVLSEEMFPIKNKLPHVDNDLYKESWSDKELERICNTNTDTLGVATLKCPPKKNVANEILKKLENTTETPQKVRKKRKFPGPAGLLPDDTNGRMHEKYATTVCSSQSFNCSQNQLSNSVFEEGPWLQMKREMNGLCPLTIQYVKNQALAHRLTGRKVPLLCGVVHTIDRTLQDPLIVLSDPSGEIQCTLHRDAWENLGCYLVPQYSVVLLKNTTVFTTGSALKKIYLNITNNNISNVYCDEENSYMLNDNLVKTCDINIPKLYSKEIVSCESTKIIVLRNNSISPQKNDTSYADNCLPPESENSHDQSDDLLVQSLLEGITDDFFED